MRTCYYNSVQGERKIHISEYTDQMDGKITCGEGHAVIAKRGNIRVHHFCHKKTVDCSYSDGMSDWHTQFQDRVEKEYQEVRMSQTFPDEDEIIHIADLCIPKEKIPNCNIPTNGYVVEFQHSPMDVNVMRERESFYTMKGYTLVWVFDCYTWEYSVMRRVLAQKDGYEEIMLRKKKGADYPLLAKYSEGIIKFLDFDKNSLLLVTKQSGSTITGLVIPMEQFDEKYLGQCVVQGRDFRDFNHPL